VSDLPEARPRRLDSRSSVALEVQVQAPGLPSVNCQVRNVSVGGMFLSTDTPFAPTSELAIRVTLPAGRGRSVTLGARVVHVLAGQNARSLGLTAGVGVRFEKLDEQGVAFVSELVEWAVASAPAPRIPRVKLGADRNAVRHDPMLGFLLGYVDGQRNVEALSQELALEVDTIERMLGELSKHGVIVFAPTAVAANGDVTRRPPTAARGSTAPPNAHTASPRVTREPLAPTARPTRPSAAPQPSERAARVGSPPVDRAVRSQPPTAVQRASARPTRAQTADTAAAAEAARVAAASSARPSRAPAAEAASEAARVSLASAARLSQAPHTAALGRAGLSQPPTAARQGVARSSRVPSSKAKATAADVPLGAAAQILAQAEAAFNAGQAMEASRHLKLLSVMTFTDLRVQQRARELTQQVLRAAAVDFEKQAAQEERNQHWDRAAKTWMRVAEGRPTDGFPLQRAALAQLQAGVELRLVMETARRAVQLSPNDAQAHRTLAKVYLAADMQASADRALEAAHRCSPMSDPSDDTPTGLLKRLLG